MAAFTIELYRVLETYPSEDLSSIGLNDYPVVNEEYRKQLNEKILNRYLLREIGHETIDHFKFAMRRKMHEIMPFFNQIIKTTFLEIDPLVTIDMETVFSGENVQESTAVSENNTASTGDSKSRSVQSNTPQVMLSGQKDYASAAADAFSESKNGVDAKEESESNTKDKSDSKNTVKGYQGSPADLIMAYRSIIVNVDLQILEELSELFMSVWNTGDSYTTTLGRYYR